MIENRNPSMKALAVLIPGIFLSFSFDMITPFIYLLYILAITFILASVPLKKWFLIFMPLSLFATSLAWMTMLYTDESYATGDVIFTFLWFEVTTGSAEVGISLALRSLCFIALSLLFVFTTNPTKFMLSLMQQCKLSPKLTYGILAGYRFLPMLQHEFELLKQAHRIRGISRAEGWQNRLQNMKQYAIPLLANSIRKAERVAIAMESKGFTGERERTYYHRMKVNRKDWIFLFGMIFALIIAYYTSYQLGYLNIFGNEIGK